MRILVVEDEPHWQNTLRETIFRDTRMSISASCGSLREALTALHSQTFDLVVADLRLPNDSGIEFIGAIRRIQPNANILVQTAFAEDLKVVIAIQAGATGYILKSGRPEEWIAAIEDVEGCRSSLTPRIARHMLQALQHHTVPEPSPRPLCQHHSSSATSRQPEGTDVPKITKRELEVLRLIAKGFVHGEVAEILGISVNTVRSHAKKIYQALEVRTKGEAVFEARAMGWL
jgi:DNA-binding NarL/FixJ family response regulator